MAKVTTKSNAERDEELGFLRQQCSSLVMRGRYTECAKLLEDNMAALYDYERWPENFFSTLKSYQRCYPALNHSEPLEEYMESLLKKKGLPFVFARFFKTPPEKWSGDYFREQAIDCKTGGKFEEALAWCDLAIKVDHLSSNLFLLRGWILEDLERGPDAVTAFERALDLNESNYKASQGIARQYAASNLNKALTFLNEAIDKHPAEPGFQAEKAAVLEKDGKREAAIECYDKAAELDPYNPEYVYRKGELLLADNKEAQAVVLFKRAVALNERHCPSLYCLAILNERTQPTAALEYITTVVAMEPANWDAALLRAHLLRRKGDFAGAIDQYQVVLEADPKRLAALSGIAYCYLRTDPEKALECYTRAVELDSRNAAYHMGKGRAHEGLAQTAQAIEAYKIVTGLDKNNHKPYGRLGELHKETDIPAALGYFEKAIALDLENAEYHAEKAKLLLRQGKEQEAMESFNTACRYDPGNAVLHYDLAVLLQKAGNRASALKNYREAVHLSPTMVPAHRNIAEMLLYSEPETALDAINTAIGIDVANPSHYFLKSRIISQFLGNTRALEQLRLRSVGMEDDGSGSYDELEEMLGGGCLKVALIHCNRAIELAPANTSYLCERANLFYRMGQQNKALEEYQRLLKADPRNHEALYGLGCILSAQKDKKALEYLDKAISIAPDIARYHTEKALFLGRDPDKYDQALASYDAAIPLDTWDATPSLEKARLMDAHGDIYGAMDSYRRALLINHNCLPATARMGELLIDRNPDAALAYCNQAVLLDPETGWHYIVRARIQAARGKAEESEADAQYAIELGKGSAEVYYALAKAYGEEYPEQSLRFGLIAVEKKPENGDYHFLCGSRYLERDELETAGRYFDKAMSLGVKEGNFQEKAVELLYRQRSPQALKAMESIPDTISAVLLKAKIYREIPEPPMLEEAISYLAGGIKLYPNDIGLRELYVEYLSEKRSLFKVPVEKAKLERLRRKLQKEAEALTRMAEISFESEEEAADETGGETAGDIAEDGAVSQEEAADAPAEPVESGDSEGESEPQ
ncbi:tetratricopeptide repeat protein [Ruminococcaceae bacterium OttesenSCG-928-L11]|nr:tetratricopeptide repeat protein [Ruminococcaceae bacterium OttesenSCG-928-L11]